MLRFRAQRVKISAFTRSYYLTLGIQDGYRKMKHDSRRRHFQNVWCFRFSGRHLSYPVLVNAKNVGLSPLKYTVPKTSFYKHHARIFILSFIKFKLNWGSLSNFRCLWTWPEKRSRRVECFFLKLRKDYEAYWWTISISEELNNWIQPSQTTFQTQCKIVRFRDYY